MSVVPSAMAGGVPKGGGRPDEGRRMFLCTGQPQGFFIITLRFSHKYFNTSSLLFFMGPIVV